MSRTEDRMDGCLKSGILLFLVAVAILFAFLGSQPKPPPPTKPHLKAEEVGESVGDKSRRFGDGFIKGWKKGGEKASPTTDKKEDEHGKSR